MGSVSSPHLPPIKSLATKTRKEAGRKRPLWGPSHQPGDTACAFVPLNSRSFVFCPSLVSAFVKCLFFKVSVRLFISLFGISSKPTPEGIFSLVLFWFRSFCVASLLSCENDGGGCHGDVTGLAVRGHGGHARSLGSMRLWEEGIFREVRGSSRTAQT